MKSILFICCFQPIILLSQSSPSNDKNWVIDAQHSDEFNSVNMSSLWSKLIGTSGSGSANTSFSANNVEFNGSDLLLKADNVGGGYLTAGIQSLGFNLRYGYFEVEALLPYGKGFWPTFWLWGANGNFSYTEFDILEPGGCQYQYADRNVCGVWYKPQENVPCSAALGSPDYMPGCDVKIEFDKQGVSNMSQNWHRYGLEWRPGVAVFYLDDIPIGTIYNNSKVPSDYCRIMIDLQISGGNCAPTNSVVFPQYMRVNYFRHYTLKKNCTLIIDKVVNGNNFNFYAPNSYSLFNSFTISNTTIPPSQNVTIRAINFIDLKSGFNVPSGSSFTAIITPCY